ncbi:formate dehydrogenase major subunit [Georgenia satyanarayanai]|uniref:Formate dehydrogenase major subunit n=3 Tax=Georgenia satyanarayanai TaxID=860221 RepID=A0A2Y9AD28_9MICO|nr:formate dehydrogenase major subunit [Georgenia satyanarayanai]SSA42431.1 formate dehydrogenase major subunit [Georgenia satyanarayanai]
MAEAHPVGFQWVMEAKRRGATVIHIDPRFTRTSALADTFVPIRVGTDIVFLGAIINYVLQNELDFREYVLAYTNAASIVSEDYLDTEDLDGLFSGFDPETRTYDTSTWQYAGAEGAGEDEDEVAEDRATASGLQHESHGMPVPEELQRDETLRHPRTVYQVLKRHFSRYTPELVAQTCGISPEQFHEVAEAWVAASGRERTTALVYSVGWTQHSVGAQYIRTGSILQLLLGNMGRPGGGIMALRGHASIQGSTDIPTLFNLLPGYLEMPNASSHPDYTSWVESMSMPGAKGFWGNASAYAASLLKAYWGEHATPENDFAYSYLPRISGDHGTYRTVLDMIEGTVKGYFLLGQNPAVGSAHGKAQRLGMANLDWLVVRDLYEIESASFWKDAPEIETGEIVTEECPTEVFLLPAASHVEKEGTFTQTQRMLQWREKAVEPTGDRRSELWFFYHLGRIMRERLAEGNVERDRPLLDLAWDYPVHGEHDEPSAEAVLREINGYEVATGRPLSTFTELRADGTTVGGCWIYTGVFADGVNQAARRKPGRDQDWVALEWGWVWPANRRILYNRASADPEGRPWSERKAYVWWDEEKGEWTGHDVPDFERTKPPSYRHEPGATGVEAIDGTDAFIMQGDGRGALFVPSGLVDGPLPTHYEPVESPFHNTLYGQQANPTRIEYREPINPMNPSPPGGGSEVFPIVFTTSRLTEHHTAGGMSRTLEYLAELQPEMFVEVSPALARERGLEHLGWCHVVTARAAVEGRVVVTDRLRPLRVSGRTVHQVWLPYHWGSRGLVTGDAANDLFGISLDPNVLIQETKAGTCDILPGRRPRGPALLEMLQGYRSRAGTDVARPIVTADPRAVRRSDVAEDTPAGPAEGSP